MNTAEELQPEEQLPPLEHFVAWGRHYYDTELAKQDQADTEKRLLKALDDRFGPYAEVPPRLPSEKAKRFSEIIKEYRACQTRFELTAEPTVASAGVYLSEKSEEVDSDELAEHIAAISYLCGLLRTYDVTRDPVIGGILRASRGKLPKSTDNVVEFPATNREAH
jgi:hypothetical protein